MRKMTQTGGAGIWWCHGGGKYTEHPHLDDGRGESEEDENKSDDNSAVDDADFSDGDIEYEGDRSGDNEDSFFSYDMDEAVEVETAALVNLEDILPEGYV